MIRMKLRIAIQILFVFIGAQCLGIGPVVISAQVGTALDQTTQVHLISPDQDWEVVTELPKTPDENASLLLKSRSKGAARKLGEYFRSGDILWSNDSKAVVFLDRHSPRDTRLLVYPVDGGSDIPMHEIDRRIRRSVARRTNAAGEILFYDMRFSSSKGKQIMVSVQVITVRSTHESGPAIQWKGSYTLTVSPLKVSENSFTLTSSGGRR